MTKEQAFFLNILADYMAERKTESVEDVDWEKIMYMSKIHEVMGIVHYQCHSIMPEEICKRSEKEYYIALYYYAYRIEAYKQIATVFQKNNIDFFAIKGTLVANYYPNPELRTMGDLDIVIHGVDRDKADKILQNLDYTRITHWDNKELGYNKNNVHVEIHDHLIYQQNINIKPLVDFLEDCWSYVNNGKIDESFHFIYLLVHLRKHLMNTGVGFRMFMDIALMSKKESRLNWLWITQQLELLGMKQFAVICFEFIEKWFGIQSPYNDKLIEDCFFIQGTEAVFLNGVFGYGNKNNSVNEMVNAVRNKKYKRILILKEKIRKVFPTYYHMKNNEYYHFISDKRWLLPVAWIYRLFRSIQMIKKGDKNILMKKVKMDKVNERERYLRNWGL